MSERQHIEVIVSDLAPPGQALVCDLSLLGIDSETKKVVVFHPEQREAAITVEELFAQAQRRDELLSRFARIVGLSA